MSIVIGAPSPIAMLGAAEANLKHSQEVATLLTEQQKPYVHLAKIDPDPYMAINGTLVADNGFGVLGASSCYFDANGDTTGLKLTPSTANTGSDYRFYPYSGYIADPIWFARNKTVSTYPQLRRVSRTSVVDPVLHSTYYYQQHHPQERVSAPAMTINDEGFFKIYTASSGQALRGSCTFLMVFVPHGGSGNYYPIYSSRFLAANGLNQRVEFWYVKGRIKMIVGNHVRLELPTYLNAYEPAIFGFSYDGPGSLLYAKRGIPVVRLFLYDRGSYTANMAAKYTHGWDLNAWIGARSTTDGGSTPDWANSADMDILEINMWNRSLDKNAIINVATLLKTLYGISR